MKFTDILNGIETHHEAVSAVASLIAAIGAIAAAIFAATSFAKLKKQVHLQEEQLEQSQKESRIRLLSSVTDVKDPVYAMRAKYLLDKTILMSAGLIDDDESIERLGPRVVQSTKERYATRAIDTQDAYFKDKDYYKVKLGSPTLNRKVYEQYAKTIFNNCCFDVVGWMTTYRANINPITNGYGDQHLDVALLIDKISFDKLPINDYWEGYFLFNDYPTGKVIRQKFRVKKLKAIKTSLEVSVDLSKKITVVKDMEASWLLKDDIIHELNADGFPDERGEYDPLG